MSAITVRITSRTAEQASQPVMYRLGKDFHVVPNIQRASITEDHVFAEVRLEGALEEVQRAIAWLHTTGMAIDAEQRCVSDGSNL